MVNFDLLSSFLLILKVCFLHLLLCHWSKKWQNLGLTIIILKCCLTIRSKTTWDRIPLGGKWKKPPFKLTPKKSKTCALSKTTWRIIESTSTFAKCFDLLLPLLTSYVTTIYLLLLLLLLLLLCSCFSTPTIKACCLFLESNVFWIKGPSASSRPARFTDCMPAFSLIIFITHSNSEIQIVMPLRFPASQSECRQPLRLRTSVYNVCVCTSYRSLIQIAAVVATKASLPSWEFVQVILASFFFCKLCFPFPFSSHLPHSLLHSLVKKKSTSFPILSLDCSRWDLSVSMLSVRLFVCPPVWFGKLC